MHPEKFTEQSSVQDDYHHIDRDTEELEVIWMSITERDRQVKCTRWNQMVFMVHNPVNVLKITPKVAFMVCDLYLNKAIIRHIQGIKG